MLGNASYWLNRRLIVSVVFTLHIVTSTSWSNITTDLNGHHLVVGVFLHLCNYSGNKQRIVEEVSTRIFQKLGWYLTIWNLAYNPLVNGVDVYWCSDMLRLSCYVTIDPKYLGHPNVLQVSI